MHTRLRVEAYDRTDRDLLLQPYATPRVVNGQVVLPSITRLFANAGRGYGRGVEMFLERKLVRGVSGWVSYAYGRSMMHNGVLQAWYPSDYDQRQTVNAYVVYAWRPSVTFSSHWSYGSGFPMPGYLKQSDGEWKYYLTNVENRLRMQPYSRLDLRMNKTWARERTKVRLFAEVENILNKTNYAFGSLNGFSTKDARADVSIQQQFPILPSAGVVFEW
jgi:hypothetical protein